MSPLYHALSVGGINPYRAKIGSRGRAESFRCTLQRSVGLHRAALLGKSVFSLFHCLCWEEFKFNFFSLRKTVMKRWRRPASDSHYFSFVCNKWHFISNLANIMITDNVYNGLHVKQFVSLHSLALLLPWNIWCNNAYYMGLKIVPWWMLCKSFCKDFYWSARVISIH